ncbi:MAG: hypothetical protein WCR20_02760 [Verrucomicrobiota bacterium]
MNWQRTTGLLLLGLGLLVLTLRLSNGYDAGPQIIKLAAKASPQLAEKLNRKEIAGYLGLGLIGLPIALGGMLFLWGLKRSSHAAGVNTGSAPTKAQTQNSKGSTQIHSCNVLKIGGDPRLLYHFEAKAGTFALRQEQSIKSGSPLPRNLVAKDWHHMFQPKLNIALMPPEQVFLRVIQIPASEPSETVSMVELQLEKLSPMPVAQIVWSIHPLPHKEGSLQTVIVMIVARNVVEDLLGELEGQGFLTDRLELPLLDELEQVTDTRDGAWIHPIPGKNSALVAWRYGGVLHNLDLLTLSTVAKGATLHEQLLQMAWAGEMEGWLNKPPIWHLVADDASRTLWEPALAQSLEQEIHLDPRPAAPEMAATTAKRVAKTASQSNLVPFEFQTRYKQQFVDRLWMRGLGAIVGLYMIGVVIYFIALSVASYRTKAVEMEAADVAPAYTNALQFKARYQVLKDRQELKFAALDCWNTTARLLPEDVTLENLSFSDGRQLRLSGTAPSDSKAKLIEFESGMRKSLDNSGQPLFDANKGDNINYRANPGNSSVTWSLTLELKRAESQ